MRTITSAKITETVKQMCLDANFNLPPAVTAELKRAYKKEKSKAAKFALETCLKNIEIAKKENLALCQDTGLAVFFIRIGQDVHIKGGLLTDAINEGVKKAYDEGYFRKSVVKDPLFERKNTKTNTPAIIHTEIVKGSGLEIMFFPKGGGAENASVFKMFKPTAKEYEIVSFITENFKEKAVNACPPCIVGIGIGGTFDYCCYLAKKALLRPLGKKNANKKYAKLENKILKELNDLNIGAQGFGGKTSALAVHIEHHPCHIAGLPVAINLNCWVHRIVKKII